MNVRGARRRASGRSTFERVVSGRADFNFGSTWPAFLNELVKSGEKIEVLYVHGHWRGVNDLEDFRLAGDFAHAQAPLPIEGAPVER